MNDSTGSKVAFVTGAGSGIGRAAATAFVRRGYATVIADVNGDAGKATQAELEQDGRCSFVLCDVTDDDSVREAIAHTVATFDRLDAAFNAAGIDGEHGKPTAEATMANWERVLAVDLTGTFSCMRHELPAIVASGGGSIVNCASVAGLRAAATLSAYTAAKHGVVGLTKAAAVEYARAGVRVNAICPGTVDTPMFRASMPTELIDRLVRTNPVGRLADASEIADIAVWLCDDATGYLTGQAITVDGGCELVTHRILLSTLVIDAPTEVRDRTVEFWAAALGADATATPMPQYHILRDAASPTRMVVQGVGSGDPSVHIDIHTDDLDAEVARLVACGATVVESWADHPGSWVVMRDPNGMEFCVVWALNERRPQADRDDFEARAKEVG